MEKKALAGRFRWLLETMMRLQGIDIQELDRSLEYWEAKAEIEAKYRTKLVLKLDHMGEKMLQERPGKYETVTRRDRSGSMKQRLEKVDWEITEIRKIIEKLI